MAITVYTNKDTWVYEEFPDTAYGSSNSVYVREKSGEIGRAFFEFDISSIPISSLITDVKLYIYIATTTIPSGYFQRITSSWNESITWNTGQPSYTTTNQYTHSIGFGWQNYDVTNICKDAKTAGDTFGTRIVSINEGSANDLETYMRSREYSGYIPYIVVTHDADRYVKIGGNDASDGKSWANAWSTINKAATTIADGSTVHIGFGTYNAEPAGNKIAPQNAGASGIKYLCETATTGGGTGSVIVEKN